MATPDVSVLIVSYNTRDLLRACLDSLRATTGVVYETLVVDNGSADGSPDLVRIAFPDCTLIVNPDNRGFAAANNVALARATGRYLLLLNPDTEVFPDTLAGMAAFLDAHPETGICGPRVLNPDGSLQSCGYHFPTPLTEVRTSKHVGRALKAVIGEERPTPTGSSPYECDWVDGACLMIRRQVVDRIGPLDEQYFLYTEELDWCFAARRAGWAIHALPQVEMLHHRGKSSEQASDWSLALLVETKLRYFRKNHGLATSLFVSLVNTAGFLKQWPREPRKNRAKLKGVRQFWAGLLASPTHRPHGAGTHVPRGTP